MALSRGLSTTPAKQTSNVHSARAWSLPPSQAHSLQTCWRSSPQGLRRRQMAWALYPCSNGAESDPLNLAALSSQAFGTKRRIRATWKRNMVSRLSAPAQDELDHMRSLEVIQNRQVTQEGEAWRRFNYLTMPSTLSTQGGSTQMTPKRAPDKRHIKAQNETELPWRAVPSFP